MRAVQLSAGTPFRVVERISDDVRTTDYIVSVGPCRYPSNIAAVRKQTTQIDGDGFIRYHRGPYHIHTELPRQMPVEERL